MKHTYAVSNSFEDFVAVISLFLLDQRESIHTKSMLMEGSVY
jgi:hypothetical protein